MKIYNKFFSIRHAETHLAFNRYMYTDPRLQKQEQDPENTSYAALQYSHLVIGKKPIPNDVLADPRIRCQLVKMIEKLNSTCMARRR
jgi:hypothetical protein